MNVTQPDLPAFLSRLLVGCLDIRSVWILGRATARDASGAHQFLVFADPAGLQRLRACDDLRELGVEMLVVVDGDAFESAWGSASGSLGRWAWRQVSPEIAYYDESSWAEQDSRGEVVRMRRKATLMWQSNASG
jgi:hypothetical protein